jgi:hypothetical protein
MKKLITLLAPCAIVVAACSQPQVPCQVSASLSYGSKWKQSSGPTDGACGGKTGETVGFASYNPRDPKGGSEDVSKAFLGVRTIDMGNLVVNADINGVDDTKAGDFPFAFGPFKNIFPTDNICTPDLKASHQVLAAVPGSVGDPEDPSDDVVAQSAVDMEEDWSNVQVFVSAGAVGTMIKAHYALHDHANSCDAEYDTLSVFPTVSCGDTEPSGGTIDIASIQEAPARTDGTRPVQVVTKTSSGLAVGDSFSVAGVDDAAGTITYNSTYTVATVSADGLTIVTNELDPYGGPQEPDPEVDNTGTIQKLVTTPNDKFCSSVAIPQDASCDPANGALTVPPTCAAGSGINPGYKITCDASSLLCVPDADPKSATLPVAQSGATF